ncbi:MAG: YggS family pyridoxal phosphate-dependent enzyme [Gammaproteobacteria bacterium]|nr:YggS family pyridoxal phosphate-dependent enzyme [Gammaproteobacteria bacterium]MDE2251107.1 YggS family pyridoxal phosphate-dependent enzyme [Gammaproteobacteria bacterium]
MLIGPQNSAVAGTLAARLRTVRERIGAAARAAGRNEDSVTLLAVSKGHAAAAVGALARLGVEHFGESYLQEALPKLDALAGLELSWHFIGHLQANKTRAVAERFAWVHGLDRLRIAERLAAQRPHWAPPLNVCVQVKLAPDATKGGASASEARALLMALASFPRLRARGLMCMLPEGLDAAGQRARFSAVRRLYEDLRQEGAALDTLSMGMSGDFEAAVAAGSTLVRIGTALLGARADAAGVGGP